jgi:hypothetical protein
LLLALLLYFCGIWWLLLLLARVLASVDDWLLLIIVNSVRAALLALVIPDLSVLIRCQFVGSCVLCLVIVRSQRVAASPVITWLLLIAWPTSGGVNSVVIW